MPHEASRSLHLDHPARRITRNDQQQIALLGPPAQGVRNAAQPQQRRPEIDIHRMQGDDQVISGDEPVVKVDKARQRFHPMIVQTAAGMEDAQMELRRRAVAHAEVQPFIAIF